MVIYQLLEHLGAHCITQAPKALHDITQAWPSFFAATRLAEEEEDEEASEEESEEEEEGEEEEDGTPVPAWRRWQLL